MSILISNLCWCGGLLMTGFLLICFLWQLWWRKSIYSSDFSNCYTTLYSILSFSVPPEGYEDYWEHLVTGVKYVTFHYNCDTSMVSCSLKLKTKKLANAVTLDRTYDDDLDLEDTPAGWIDTLLIIISVFRAMLFFAWSGLLYVTLQFTHADHNRGFTIYSSCVSSFSTLSSSS